MEKQERFSLHAGRQFLEGLRDLGDVAAPPSLLGTILARAGLGDAYWSVEAPIGRVYVAHNAEGIAMVALAQNDEVFQQSFQARFHRPAYPVAEAPPRLARQVAGQLRGAGGQRLRYDLRGLTEFERAVLLKALEIPRGEVRPYAWIAREIGHPAAVRAVGSALGNNPVPLLIPCHRVVRSDGHIGNHALGSDTKRAILEEEGIEVDKLERLARSGVRYYGSDSTRIYCFPTCRNARRITEQHRVAFGSAEEAAASGYRPCLVCRPASVS